MNADFIMRWFLCKEYRRLSMLRMKLSTWASASKERLIRENEQRLEAIWKNMSPVQQKYTQYHNSV